MTISSAVITGGASGIGAALAQELAAAGARVIIADIGIDRAEVTAAAIRDHGGDAVAMLVDHTDEASVAALADASFDHLGQVDVVFANAGVGAGGPIYTTPQRSVDWIIGVNLLGPLWLSRHFVPKMIAQGSAARFIVTGSEHSIGLPARGGQASIYTISKHAVLGFAETLRRDLAQTNVAVSIICPAVVNTDILANSARTRHEKYGGPRVPSNVESGLTGIDPDVAAKHILGGIDASEFYLFTHHDDLAQVHEARATEISGALERFKIRSA